MRRARGRKFVDNAIATKRKPGAVVAENFCRVGERLAPGRCRLSNDRNVHYCATTRGQLSLQNLNNYYNSATYRWQNCGGQPRTAPGANRTEWKSCVRLELWSLLEAVYLCGGYNYDSTSIDGCSTTARLLTKGH